MLSVVHPICVVFLYMNFAPHISISYTTSQTHRGSGSYGTVHRGYLIQSKENIQPCIAKRAWTFSELEANIPTQIFKIDKSAVAQRTGMAVAQRTGVVSSNGDVVSIEDESNTSALSKEELKTKAERCQHFWNF